MSGADPEGFSSELLQRLERRGLMTRTADGFVRLTPAAVEIARKGRGISGIDLVGGILALAREVGMSEIKEVAE